jgi:hypothetical protein
MPAVNTAEWLMAIDPHPETFDTDLVVAAAMANDGVIGLEDLEVFSAVHATAGSAVSIGNRMVSDWVSTRVPARNAMDFSARTRSTWPLLPYLARKLRTRLMTR